MAQAMHESLDKNLVFLITAVIYYVVFSIVRFHSSMDEFSSRFFEPATLLLSVALIGYVLKCQAWKNVRPLVFVFMAAILCLNISEILNTNEYTKGSSYYSNILKINRNQYSGIPEYANVLYFSWDNRNASAVVEQSQNLHRVMPEDTPQSMCDSFSGEDYFYITKMSLSDYVMNGAVPLTEEMKTYLSDIYMDYFENSNLTFVKVSQKTGEVID